ncbi:methylmalonyl-CoA mutase [Ureibacillus sp. Re31]|uniref:Methylmalonyl-CoA mutase n=1 Tax=Ureibacillus galli TaxID=2762222 RepID=A0ABR8X9Y1_9BACL|nr:methylmalonyl-CoA mutase family protein [Ureibacillus galli]MBD8026129.1 methylmalonyl-CoA mutase [Ureibacillus galli]
MTIQMKSISFPTAHYGEWKEQAIKALKGKPFESLFTKTIEGVTLEPLYTRDMVLDQLNEQLEKQISTIRSLKSTTGLKVAQQIYGSTAEEFFARLQDSIDKGNEVVTIDSRIAFEWHEENLMTLAEFLTENSFKLFVQNAKDPILNVFKFIKNYEIKGFIISNEPIQLDNFEHVRTISANIVTYHHEGAHAIQELALSLAFAAKFAEQEGDFNRFINKFFVNFAVDTSFFGEIAKLRAFKVLWKVFTSGYGITEARAIPVVAETSLRSFSTLDVYVNLLRAGNEAFAALIGGADLFTVHPHDCLTNPTDKSIRIARNVLLVLKEESFVEKVLDPSGGSYFIESLTAEYVEKAWKLFLEIEEAGGIDAYIESGKLKMELETVYENRLKAVETRKQSLIGTNIYANPTDEITTEMNPLFKQVKRLAIPFEQLRVSYQKVQPKIGILTYGKLKDFKPRADYVSGIFATAGISPDQSGEIQTIESAQTWLQNGQYDYVIFVAKDDETKKIVPTLLSSKPKNLLLDVAGKFVDEQNEWIEKGVNGFIFAGQNMVKKLTDILESLQGVQR